MTQFATSDDLATRLGVTLTDDEIFRADALLEIASGLIQEETKQTIELVTGDELTRPSVYGDRLRLPQRPVQQVNSVTLQLGDNTPVDLASDSWYLDGDEIVRSSFPLDAAMYFHSGTRGWLGPLWTITIDYDHGYEDTPAAVKALCLEMVVRVWVNPGSVAQESVGNTSTLYYYASNTPDASGILLTRSEKTMLRRLFARPSSTITLR